MLPTETYDVSESIQIFASIGLNSKGFKKKLYIKYNKILKKKEVNLNKLNVIKFDQFDHVSSS